MPAVHTRWHHPCLRHLGPTRQSPTRMGVETMAFDKMLVAIAVATSANFFVGEALAQRPEAPSPKGQRPTPSGVETPTLGPEKSVEGQVQSVNASGTEITLTDGTTLMTPLGAAIRPGVLEGFTVVAS